MNPVNIKSINVNVPGQEPNSQFKFFGTPNWDWISLNHKSQITANLESRSVHYVECGVLLHLDLDSSFLEFFGIKLGLNSKLTLNWSQLNLVSVLSYSSQVTRFFWRLLCQFFELELGLGKYLNWIPLIPGLIGDHEESLKAERNKINNNQPGLSTTRNRCAC